MPPEEKQVLQTAAVIGKDVPFVLLQAIAAQNEETLRRGLTHLQAAEFLYETNLFPDLEYTFKHALTHEVAYASLLQGRRRDLHARIVEAIEQLYPGRLAEHADRLAHHALKGELGEKAVGYLCQAGDKAAARSAHRKAVAYFEQALAVLTSLSRKDATHEQEIDLRLNLRSSLQQLGEHRLTLDHLRKAETLATDAGDQRRLGRIAAGLGQYFFAMGEPDRAVESAQRALSIGAALKDVELEVAATGPLGIAYHVMGNYPRAIEALRRSLGLLKGDLVRERFRLATLPSVRIRAWLALCLADVGEFTEAVVRAEEALQIAEAVDAPSALIGACMGAGYAYFFKGDLRRAVSILERGLNLHQMWNLPTNVPTIGSLLGSAYILSGRVAEALPLLEGAVELSATMRRAWHSAWVSRLSEGYLRAGRTDEAFERAARALELSRELKERGHEAWALRLVGEIGSHRGPVDIDMAERHYRQAIVLANDLGMRPLVAHCHLGLGELYQRTGKRHQAQEYLSTATTMYREMDMTYWLEQAEEDRAKASA